MTVHNPHRRKYTHVCNKLCNDTLTLILQGGGGRPSVYDAPSVAPTPGGGGQQQLPRMHANAYGSPYANRRMEAGGGAGAPIKLAPIEGPKVCSNV
jgi:hypothetical protein